MAATKIDLVAKAKIDSKVVATKLIPIFLFARINPELQKLLAEVNVEAGKGLPTGATKYAENYHKANKIIEDHIKSIAISKNELNFQSFALTRLGTEETKQKDVPKELAAIISGWWDEASAKYMRANTKEGKEKEDRFISRMKFLDEALTQYNVGFRINFPTD